MTITPIPSPQNWKTIQPLPLAAVCNPMASGVFSDLVDGMTRDGFSDLHPIIVVKENDGWKVIDGWNRLQGAIQANVVPSFMEFKGTHNEIINLVQQENVNRRDHTEDAKIQIILALEKRRLPEGRPPTNKDQTISSQNNYAGAAQLPASIERIASIGKWSRRRVDQNIEVGKKAPEEIKAIIRGEKTAYGVLTKAKAAAAKKAPPGPTPPLPPRPMDAAGKPMPKKSYEALTKGRERFMAAVKTLRAVKKELLALAAEPIGRCLHSQTVETDCKNLIRQLDQSAPYTTCPLNGGNCDSKCQLCRGTQWVSELQWGGVPKEFK